MRALCPEQGMISIRGVDHSFHLSDHGWNALGLGCALLSPSAKPQFRLVWSSACLFCVIPDCSVWRNLPFGWRYIWNCGLRCGKAWDIHRSQRNERSSGVRLAGRLVFFNKVLCVSKIQRKWCKLEQMPQCGIRKKRKGLGLMEQIWDKKKFDWQRQCVQNYSR